MSQLTILPCLDSDELATSRKQELHISKQKAIALGQSAVEAVNNGYYINSQGKKVDWGDAVQAACEAKVSIRADARLPAYHRHTFSETIVQVTNETTLGAAHRLVHRGLQSLALNFANGKTPGGGFLNGARAQEETLCRSSALYATLEGDKMYEAHAKRSQPDSTEWAIYSPDVPVFRQDDGTVLDHYWFLSFISCAAPYAPSVGQPISGNLLQKRIDRILEIARAYGHISLVLGAWGCGVFANDPYRTARDFRYALEFTFSGAFAEVVFAITDWSPDRKYLGPFREIFRE